MAIWPFRKSTTIYNFDDNWRPEVIQEFGPDGSPADFNIIIPDDFYAILTSMHFQSQNAGGIGSSNVDILQYRGSQLVYQWRFQNGTQETTFADWFFTNSGAISDTSSIANNPHLPIPINHAVLPKDRFWIYFQSSKAGCVNPYLILNLQAYYF